MTTAIHKPAAADHVGLIVQHVLMHADPSSVPLVARNAAKIFMLDSIGVALAGASVAESSLVRRAALTWGKSGGLDCDASVWGSREKLPAPSAAMVNAFHIHNQEFDCVHEKAVVHPMAVILAALMAYAERNGQVSGAKFLAALEIKCQVNQERHFSTSNFAKTLPMFSMKSGWAMTQNNLGEAYGNRTRGERADNLELAIVAYNLSLEVLTPTAFPIDCLRTGRNLGKTANSIEDWETAIKGYNLAIEAVENTLLQALNPQRQQEILSDAMDVYHGIVQSYLNLDQPDRALEYVERSKTRYLVQLLTDRDIYPKGNIPQTIITELDRLRRAIIGEEQQLAIQEQTRNRGVILTPDQQKQPILNDYTHLNKLKQELNQFIDREITKTKIDEDFILTQTVKPIPFQDILSLTDAETCLLQWYITSEKILAFVVSADGNINLWESSEDDRDKLTDLINNYLQLYYSQNGHQEWINQLSDLLQTFSDTLHINDILALIPNTCKRLIIIPYLFLHILPLHALPINDNQILQDKYDVQYAPSCQLFKITQQRQLNDLNSLFAIQNPQNNLLFTDLEVEIIKNLFVQSDILAKQNATEIAIKTHQNFPLANCIHFSCHGTFNRNKPLESALILTKEKTDQEDGYLRLGEIFELNFKNCRLVMLSACETGLIDLNSISDEYIGLPSGFLFAGSPSVVSSLWKVNDLSTAFLLIKFYETLPKNPQKGEIAVSLKNAQKWLQTLTLDQFEQELERFQLQLDKIINQLGGGKRPIFNESLKQIRQRQPYPFKNPYYWAGFIATGF